ncbi:hypothetical protein HMPREF0454_00674 [Hafnia alvei ATCC 51873]|uniref:Uncharacterized protein n=1 Tax=Hafnia alvei ATCC 51873 TaxID=1002364 RepID=G9Y262_HAFAL|nr:hypothetical protein HMPREF0454_00674 [Hafnia alvei ATCC 51873]
MPRGTCWLAMRRTCEKIRVICVARSTSAYLIAHLESHHYAL